MNAVDCHKLVPYLDNRHVWCFPCANARDLHACRPTKDLLLSRANLCKASMCGSAGTLLLLRYLPRQVCRRRCACFCRV